MEHIETDVVIVGGGPVGLSLATELNYRNVRSVVLECHDRIGVQPRAKTTNVRTMQHMRRWGLADSLRRKSPLPVDFGRNVVFATRMTGQLIHRFHNAFYAEPAQDQRFPEAAQWIPQYVVEKVLADHVLTAPNAKILMSTTVNSLRQDGERVTVLARTVDDREIAISGRYAVGADGARSTVRKLLTIEMEGLSSLVSFVSLVIKIPGLATQHSLGDALMYWLVNAEAPVTMGPLDQGDTWFWATSVPPGDIPDEAAIDRRVRASIGADIDYEILSRDNWSAHKLLATRYSSGRVLLAGDACHLHSPFGGYGMNLGIADAVDLGWKIAALVQGWGGPGLLDSYEAERKPVHRWVLEESTDNVAMLSNHFVDDDIERDDPKGVAARSRASAAVEIAKRREFDSLGLVLGYSYAGSPLTVDGPATFSPSSVVDFEPRADIGRLAPHGWLADGTSLYDHFSKGFTLLIFGAGMPPGAHEIQQAAARAGMPLAILPISDTALTALYRRRFALVRPDQHLAWVGDTIDDAEQLVETVRGAILEPA